MFKVYETGNDFVKDNKEILNAYPLKTSFFKSNAGIIKQFSKESFFFKFYDEAGNYLLVSRYLEFSLLVFGSEKFIDEAIETLSGFNITFDGVLATDELANEFLVRYEAIYGGSHASKTPLDLLATKTKTIEPSAKIEKCTNKDYRVLMTLFKQFQIETGRTYANSGEIAKHVVGLEHYFYCVRENERIVAIGKKTRIEDEMISVSCLYTVPEYRHKGYAKAILAYITNEITASGKLAYLFVNPEYTYTKNICSQLGYTKHSYIHEQVYIPGSIKTFLASSENIYKFNDNFKKLNGVVKVTEGYSGGSEFMPTLSAINSGETHHRRTLLIEFDSDVITYEDLVNEYFNLVDPISIDTERLVKGTSYSCAIYAKSLEEVTYIRNKITELEIKLRKKVHIDTLPQMVFYTFKKKNLW